MKKNTYIQPRSEVTPVTAMNNLLSASKPFTDGGGTTNQEMY